MEDMTNRPEDAAGLGGGPGSMRQTDISIDDFEAALNARAAQMEAEAAALGEDAWKPAPDGHSGGTYAAASDKDTGHEDTWNIAPDEGGDETCAAAVLDEDAADEDALKPASDEDDEETHAAPERKRQGHPFLLALVLILFVGFLGAVFYTYRHYVDFFRTHFYSGTTINGIDVSYMTVEEAKQNLANTIAGYHLTVEERDGVAEILTSEDIGLAYVDDLAVDKLMMRQDADRWLFEMNDEVSAEVAVSTTYDEQKAMSAVLNLKCLNQGSVVEPENASLVAEGSLYTIKPEVAGNKIDEAKLLTMVLDALDEGAVSCSLMDQDCYIYPTVTADDPTLNARLNAWNKYLQVELVYPFGDNREVINGETLRPYITDDGTTVTLSTDWIEHLVYQWGQKYDTFGLERQFTTHSGQTITVPGGDYGWVIDKEKTIEDVKTAVEEGLREVRTPIFQYCAMGWDNGDLTGTYVEVSISEQRLWCYKDGVCVMETDVVTGKASDPERMTVTGCWAIDAKKKDATLGTEDVQGYSEPVSFWLPFNGGQGLHDAPWRTEFGGTLYQEGGSHGCVNVPADKMETIFNAMEIGNAVVVYDLNASAE